MFANPRSGLFLPRTPFAAKKEVDDFNKKHAECTLFHHFFFTIHIFHFFFFFCALCERRV